MWESLRQLWTGTLDSWRRLSPSARINIALTGFATAALIVALVVYGSRQQYIVLYGGLEDAAETGRMQALLKENGIPYRMADSNTTLLVPDSRAGDARMTLRAQNLPSSHGLTKGWEILDEESMWVTPEKHEDNRRRAIQGELQRMLNELEFVRRSFVYIHHAEDSLYKKDQKPSSAAISLDVTRPLTQKEVDAIVGIVSSFGGVKLQPSHITVVTTDGQQLKGPLEDEMARIASNKQEAQLKWERERAQKAIDVLAAGGRKSAITVSAQMDFAHTESVEDRVEEGAPISTAETTTELTTEESLPEGPPGAFANMPEGVPGPTQTRTVESTEETIDNSEPSRTQMKRVIEPGDVLGYKVSAIVDYSRRPSVDGDGNPTGEMEYAPLSDEERERFRSIIANAVGYNCQPTDVEIMDMPFELEQLKEAQLTFASLERANVVAGLLEWGGYLLKIAVVLVLFWWVRRKFLKLTEPIVPEVEEEAPPAPLGPSPEEIRRREVAQAVEKLALQQPEAVASLLRAWMSESED